MVPVNCNQLFHQFFPFPLILYLYKVNFPSVKSVYLKFSMGSLQGVPLGFHTGAMSVYLCCASKAASNLA